jgi:hypothetical protein
MAKADGFCPYIGLQPYSVEDRDYFFGREEDRETIAANLLSAPLTIMYGDSGVGKTSVLQAGVVPFLEAVPDVTVVLFNTWQESVKTGQQATFLSSLRLKAEIVRAVNERTGEKLSVRDTPLDELLVQAAYVTRSTLILILDQFEEYFRYRPTEDIEDPFDADLARVVNRRDVDANVLFAVRQDGLSLLDRFQGRIPHLFANRLRLEHLDREAARAAIEKPVEQYNRLRTGDGGAIQLEAGLVEAVLDELGTGQVALGEIGRGGVVADQTSSGAPIETAYLQLVMTRLWDEEVRAGSRTLRLATLQKLGGAGNIVRTHLDTVVNQLPRRQRKVAASLFRYLVTPSGQKIAYTCTDLTNYAKTDPQETQEVLRRLSEPSIRLLRPVSSDTAEEGETLYEIFHDKLGPAVIDWQASFWRRHRRKRRLIVLLGVVAVITFIVVAFGLTAEGPVLEETGFFLLVFLPFLVVGFILGILWKVD